MQPCGKDEELQLRPYNHLLDADTLVYPTKRFKDQQSCILNEIIQAGHQEKIIHQYLYKPKKKNRHIIRCKIFSTPVRYNEWWRIILSKGRLHTGVKQRKGKWYRDEILNLNIVPFHIPSASAELHRNQNSRRDIPQIL